jgi:hypothetical protein
VPFTYHTGQEIRKGERVFYHGEPGEIEFVADPLVEDVKTAWYVEEYGGGVMVIEPKYFGRVFIQDPKDDEDLLFVSRLD